MDPSTHRLLQRARNRRNQLDNRIRDLEWSSNKRPLGGNSYQHSADSTTPKLRQEDFGGGVSAISEENEISRFVKRYNSDKEESTKQKVENKEKFIRSQLKRLGILYSDSQISSPIHRTESNFSIETKVTNSPKPTALVARLAALADNIKQWEDDVHHPGSANKTQDYKSGCMSESNVARPNEITSTTKNRAQTAPKRVTWDEKTTQKSDVDKKCVTFKSSQDTLNSNTRIVQERTADGDSTNNISISHRFKRRHHSNVINPSCSFESYHNDDKVINSCWELKKPRNNTSSRSCYSMDSSVLKKDSSSESFCILDKDPIELSVSERKALFERNKGQALLPKTPFSLYSPTKYLERAFYKRVHL